MLSFAGSALLLLTLAIGVAQVLARLFLPQLAPKGVTTLLLTILFFGSVNMFGIAVLGEYIAKIFEEVKQRPHFIRRSIIKDGEIRSASEGSGQVRSAP
jgi:dolichol-phosphate mannosyltransferase